jgi:glucose uptake protein
MLCLVLSMVCFGSWANLQKRTGKWRYELFYWDFSIGILLAAVLAAFTLGSLDSSQLSYSDNLLISSYHKIAYGLEGGLVLGFSNLLLVGALSVAPMAVVFPVAMGVALVVQVASLVFAPQGNVLILIVGTVLVLAAIVVNAFAYSTYALEQRAVKKPLTPDPRLVAVKPPLPAKGVTLSVISGIAMGLAPMLTDLGRTGEDGLGAYAAALLVAVAVLASTFLFAPFFVTFAVHGTPVQFRSYFKGGKGVHLTGLFAGMLWSVGLIAAYTTGGAVATIHVSSVITGGFTEGAAVLATLWGLFGWREFQGANPRVRILLTAMLFLWIVGAGMITIAPLYSK